MSDPFSFNRLGPFYRLQRRLHLLSDTDLAAGRRGVIFMLLAWVPVLLLAAMQGHLLNADHERAILFDFVVYASALAIVVFVLMEQTSDKRMAWLVSQFTAFGIVPEASRASFVQVRRAMERRTASWVAEAVILIAAYLMAFGWVERNAMRADGGTWAAQMQGGSLALTLAGWWALLVALPLFWFLLGRWLWRFITWAWMLRDIAGCDLRLVATHPDRCGGIAFIGQYPKNYTLFVFALSGVIAAGVLKHVIFAGASLMSFKFALFGMVVFLVVAFALPLLAFSPVLKSLKRKGLSDYGALASRHNLAFEAKWLGAAADAPSVDPLGTPDVASLADLAAGYELVQNMRTLPLTKSSILPLVLAAMAPLAAVAQAPVKQILGEMKGLMLL
jgi:hypothetical protein